MSGLKSSRGSVAVLALWTALVLAFLAVGLAHATQQKMSFFQHIHARELTRTLADSAVKKTLAEIQAEPFTLGDAATGKEWYYETSGQSRRIFMGEAAADIEITDENSKLNLNKASSQELADLLYFVARADTNLAVQLSQAIADFRDSDDFVTGEYSGSEKGAYRQSGLSYEPKNRDFEYIEELTLVRGLTKDLYGLVRPYITIYGDGRVNINTCRKETLYALGAETSLADKIMELREKAILFKNLSSLKEELSRAYSLSSEEKESLMHLIVQGKLSVTSDHFTLEGRARIFEPPFSTRFRCVYGVREGIRQWMEG